MKAQIASTLLIGVITCMSAVFAADSNSGQRVWTDQTGRKVSAQLLSVQGADVILLLANQTKATVPLTKFSASDQTYVKEWLKSVQPKVSPLDSAELKWPISVEVDPKSLQIFNGDQNEAARSYNYRSGSFQFTSNAPLTGTVMRDIASDFELVKQLFVQLPWGWNPKPEGGSNLFQAYLHETQKDYIAAGGDDNSSGRSIDGVIFTQFNTLGLKKVGDRYARDAKRDRDGEMIGLILRLIMGEMRDLCMVWSGGGLERFLEDGAYRNGSFQLAKPERGIKDMIEENISRYGISPDVDEMIKLLHLKSSESRGGEVIDIRRRNYFHGAMLIFYFGYLDGKGDGARLHKYFQAMAKDATAWRFYSQARKLGNNTVPNPRPNTTFENWSIDLAKIVIDERSDEQLRTEMTAKLKSIGIKL